MKVLFFRKVTLQKLFAMNIHQITRHCFLFFCAYSLFCSIVIKLLLPFASDKVDPLTAKGLSYLSQGEKEKLIREKRANNIRMGIPNRDDEDSSHVFREKGSNNLITTHSHNQQTKRR
jgi:hypothetical protein